MENKNQENINETVVDDKKEQFINKKNEIVEKSKDLAEKGVALFKSNPKKYGIIGGAGLAGLIAVIVAICLIVGVLCNNYKTPVKTMEKLANMQKYSSKEDISIKLLNGFCEDEFENIFKIYKQSEDFEDNNEDAKDDFADKIEELEDEYGKNYKYTYKITDKEKLEKDDLRDFRDNLRNAADMIESMIEEAEDYDSDEWEELADEMGLDGKKSKAKDVFEYLEKIRKNLKKAKVTAGYELEVTVILTGSELDEPEEEEITITVYKVDGRWISNAALTTGFGMIS